MIVPNFEDWHGVRHLADSVRHSERVVSGTSLRWCQAPPTISVLVSGSVGDFGGSWGRGCGRDGARPSRRPSDSLDTPRRWCQAP
jgi:hypothetical protein